MDDNNRNFILAIVLSMVVLFAWQMFFGLPKQQEVEAEKQAQQQPAQEQPGPPQPSPQAQPGATSAPSAPGVTPPSGLSREAALAASPRVPIDTPSLKGSIALKGARIDDLTLEDYRVTVNPNSPHVILLSPAGSPHPYYAEQGFVGAPGSDLGLPNAETLWEVKSSGPLTPQSPLELSYDNGKGLNFTRTIAVDDHYMFTVRDVVANNGSAPVTLYPYALVSRHELPETEGFYILHEGLVGVLGEAGLEEIDYDTILEDKSIRFKSDTGWLGITDKYWGTVVIPEQNKPFEAGFSGTHSEGRDRFQADYLMAPIQVPAGGRAETRGLVFAGAKEVNVVDDYAEKFGIPKFDLLIDWGWFYFLTKPLFFALDYFYKLVGNFGVAILIVTFLIKLVLFPFAHKSYVSMSRMKKLQPDMERIKKRFGEDRARMQQAMMELYKKEKVNPASGCLPILLQIPVFFALYKVLFITIEMRHAPFFGWIKDLSAPDPTSVFNLFGLIPWTPPEFLMIGVWPILMGLTMWIQMKLNPSPPDPMQQKLFTWMPIVFTFLLARFPAGLVIYWAWNNSLSVLQQSVIMVRQGVEIPLLENLGLKPAKPEPKPKEGPKPAKKKKKRKAGAQKDEDDSED